MQKEQPSDALLHVIAALQAVHVTTRKRETYIADLENFHLKIGSLFPEEFSLAKIAASLEATNISWTSLPWENIMSFVDPVTLVRLARLTCQNGRWKTVHDHCLKSLPFVLTLDPRAQLPAQRLVGRCTGQYAFDRNAQIKRYVLVNNRVGKNRCFLVLARGRWQVGPLCARCRSKKVSDLCHKCLKTHILISNSRTKRFPPFNLEWKISSMLGEPSLQFRSVVGAHSARPLYQTVDLLYQVHLVNTPRHLSTLSGNFRRCLQCPSYNGLPVFQYQGGNNLIMRILAAPGRASTKPEFHTKGTAYLFRDDAGYWTIKIGTYSSADPLKFIRSSKNFSVFRSSRCGSILPCSLIDDVPSSSWTWDENVSFRTAAQQVAPSSALSQRETWTSISSLRLLRGSIHNVSAVIVSGETIRDSEFEGVYNILSA